MNNQLALTRNAISARLDAVADPASGKGLFTSGRISGLAIEGSGKVSFIIEAPADAVESYHAVRAAAEAAVRDMTGVSAVNAVLTAHETAKIGGVRQVGAIIAVASAKGGVGKSTVAVNLACAFAALGKRTGLLDLDVYGPSAPTLLGVRREKPTPGPGKTILPIEAHGLTTMSIGYLVDPEQAMIWRGAMATSAARQMLDEVAWGTLDILVLDLPPGTGDVQVTLAQHVKLAGAVIISTPQEMALADVRRGITMFERVHAPILGVIENMAYFEQADGTRSHIFGHGGARRTAEANGVPFLGEIPILPGLRESCDAGTPFVISRPDDPLTQRFKQMAAEALVNGTRMHKPAPTISVI